MPLVALLRLSAATAATVILFMTWAAAPGQAEGILYAVPDQPPPAQEAVGFTNHLNHRVRHLPESLNPPTAETPAQVGARIHTLERGVVIHPTKGKAKGKRGETGAHPGSAATKAGGKSGGGGSHTTSAVTDAPAPLTVAFIGAGILAALGLLLSARGMRQRVRTG